MMFKIFLLLLVQNEKKFVFKPNDPTSATKLDVEFTRIKGASCFSKLAGQNFSRFQFHVPFRLNFTLTVCLCYPLLFCPCQCQVISTLRRDQINHLGLTSPMIR